MKRWLSENIATWIGLLVMGAIVVTLGVSLAPARDAGSAEQLLNLQEAIERAAVQCYALEGAYPPDVAYLERYGVIVSDKPYFIHYEIQGANLRPEIIVFPEAVTP